MDFFLDFCPIARSKNIRTVLRVAAKGNISQAQFNVATALLNGKFDEEIYIYPRRVHN